MKGGWRPNPNTRSALYSHVMEASLVRLGRIHDGAPPLSRFLPVPGLCCTYPRPFVLYVIYISYS